jgi:hypothetical protein
MATKTTTVQQLVVGKDGKLTTGTVTLNSKGQVVSTSSGSSSKNTSSPTSSSKTTYADLSNDKGTIVNNKTGKRYSTPDELAKDLGISVNNINWGSIGSSGSSPAQTGKVGYDSLVNVGGEIRNSVTGERYSSKEALAQAMGIGVNQINWNNIRQDNVRLPEMKLAVPGQTNTSLQSIYNSRPDLQALYNPDGSAKNPADPRVAGIPTLDSWMIKYGSKEYPNLDPRNQSLAPYFTAEEIARMPEDIKTSLAAFADVQTKNFELGVVNADINAKTWADAMAAAAQDPSIRDKYGDELRRSTETLRKAVESLGDTFRMQEAANLREQELERQRLSEIEAAAGRAYSGFREQAKERLSKEHSDVIKSGRMQLQQSLQSLQLPFESRFGTNALKNLKLPDISGIKYDPISGLVGSFDREKKDASKALARDFYEATNQIF